MLRVYKETNLCSILLLTLAMLPYSAMRIPDERRLENIDQRIQELETELTTRRAKLHDQRRRVRKRLSARDRKRETQRLIVRGRFFDHVIRRLASNPPDCPAASPKFRAWLDSAFDAFVTRADHRALFDLPSLAAPTPAPAMTDKPGSAGPAPTTSRLDPIPGWKPKHHEGAWAAIYEGDTSTLPDELVGCRIIVKPRNGTPWTTTVTEVLERDHRSVIVRTSGKPDHA